MMKVPLEERPRERLLIDGADALSNAELLAIILGSGTKGQSVLELSIALLSHFGGLIQLLDASIMELTEVKGIGKAKALQITALFAIAKRTLRVHGFHSPGANLIQNSEDAYNAMADLFTGEKKERLVVLLLDCRLAVIHREVVGIGTLSQVLVHPREVFRPAIRYQASSLILAHNHPSGEATPSESDIAMTKIVRASGEIMGIKLWDHLIVGKGAVFSFKDKRML